MSFEYDMKNLGVAIFFEEWKLKEIKKIKIYGSVKGNMLRQYYKGLVCSNIN